MQNPQGVVPGARVLHLGRSDNCSCRCGDPTECSQARNSDDDTRHAIDDAIAAITRPEQPEFTMLIGPDANARLVEVGIIETDDQDDVIHAMPARVKYLSTIDPSKGD